jgi:hypothetical protein
VTDDRAQRIADNERFIRDANREIEHETEAWLSRGSPGRDDYELELFCACGRDDCREKLLITIGHYEAVHSHPHRFVVVPGHANPEVEYVVENHGGYDVVEKLPQYQTG